MSDLSVANVVGAIFLGLLLTAAAVWLKSAAIKKQSDPNGIYILPPAITLFCIALLMATYLAHQPTLTLSLAYFAILAITLVGSTLLLNLWYPWIRSPVPRT